jgi:hypothetical protein
MVEDPIRVGVADDTFRPADSTVVRGLQTRESVVPVIGPPRRVAARPSQRLTRDLGLINTACSRLAACDAWAGMQAADAHDVVDHRAGASTGRAFAGTMTAGGIPT